MQRENKDSRKIVSDSINTRAEMKRRRKSLQRKPSRETSKMQNNVTDETNEVFSDERIIWPQTLIFPEGTITFIMIIVPGIYLGVPLIRVK